MCSNRPTFLVDNAPWYKEAFDRLGLDYMHMTFGYRIFCGKIIQIPEGEN